MKNLLIYISPKHSFNEEHEVQAKIQIDNSLELGWKPEDIVFIANFPYEYNGIKSTVVSDKYLYTPLNTVKFPAVARMFEEGLIKNELYWMHDLDSFQLVPLDSDERIIQEMGGRDIGMCDYGRRHKINGGSVFFTNQAGDIFKRIREVMDEYEIEEERATMLLTNNNKSWAYNSSVTAENKYVPAGIKDSELLRNRIMKMNVTYNIWAGNIQGCYRIAFKPIKAIHFNPFPEPVTKNSPCANKINYMLGDNIMRKVFMNKRLEKIFNKHGLYGTTNN